MSANIADSDEAYARRLQAQEIGNNQVDAQTPLMNRNNENPTVINARMSEISGSRATACVITSVNAPQILATIIVLSLHWNDPIVCDKAHTYRWKYWAICSAFRMLAYTLVIILIHCFRTWLNERPNYQTKAISIRNSIDAFGLIWFVVGNMWLFGDDDNSCQHPTNSPIYNLCVSLLIINYIQICLPCIIAILMIPIFCFCMPCLIRVLARLHDPRSTAGASDDIIDNLPTIKVGAQHLRPDSENTCPICLNEMVIDEEARLLRCQHLFHKQCVDEWLRVNASCPTCRKRIIDDSNNPNHAGSNNRTNNRTNTNVNNITTTNNGEIAMNPLLNRTGNNGRNPFLDYREDNNDLV